MSYLAQLTGIASNKFVQSRRGQQTIGCCRRGGLDEQDEPMLIGLELNSLPSGFPLASPPYAVVGLRPGLREKGADLRGTT